MVRFVEGQDEPLYLIVVAFRHVGVNEDRLFHGAIQRGFEFQFSRLESVDLVADHQGIDAVFDGLDQLRDGLFRALQLSSIGV
ncbi:MAG TPA: hypothetical protein VGW40_07515 [Allosphingosinicella sp.]|nr:hypothetical protein [Allosphingosinicella sp.]